MQTCDPGRDDATHPWRSNPGLAGRPPRTRALETARTLVNYSVMISDDHPQNLLAAPKVDTPRVDTPRVETPMVETPMVETASSDLDEERRPQRLGRESTPIILPKSYRVKRMRRGRKRKLVLYSSVALVAIVMLVFVVGFALRNQLQELLFPRRAAVTLKMKLPTRDPAILPSERVKATRPPASTP